MTKVCPLNKTECCEGQCAWWLDADAWDKRHGYNGCCAVLALAGVPDAIDDLRVEHEKGLEK